LSKRRVVITGMGAVTPLGNSVDSTWQGLLAGQSGIAPIERFDVADFKTQFGGAIKDLDINLYMAAKDSRKYDDFILYGIAAAEQAITESGLKITDLNAPRVGTIIGAGIGGLNSIEKAHSTLLKSGPKRVSPFFVPGTIINMISGYLSIKHNLRGPNLAIVTACTTGTHAIGLAAREIAFGYADAMIAGGAEMSTTPVGLASFGAARALSTNNQNPTQASRPWDTDRDGFVLSDGAGVVVLEEYELAKKRGANIVAEVCGFGMSSDAYHVTSPPPDGAGAVLSMQNALADANLSADQIGYINAHGTSTLAGDLAENHAVKKVFSTSLDNLAVSSTKSMTGHLLGAAGAVEAIFTALAIKNNVAPPTINLDKPAAGCDLNYVPHTAQEKIINYALSNSFGFGGTNGTLIFGKV
jgi:3-oxoacyl-[acyl-carrier-protein] synthase II